MFLSFPSNRHYGWPISKRLIFGFALLVSFQRAHAGVCLVSGTENGGICCYSYMCTDGSSGGSCGACLSAQIKSTSSYFNADLTCVQQKTYSVETVEADSPLDRMLRHDSTRVWYLEDVSIAEQKGGVR